MIGQATRMTNFWHPDIIKNPSAAAWSDGRYPREAVALHIMQGFARTMREWARERPRVHNKSVHLTVDRIGNAEQHVPMNASAWHAGVVRKARWAPAAKGNPNRRLVGVELEGFSPRPRLRVRLHLRS